MQAQPTHLGHKDPHTLAQIFQHPVSHNLEWNHVIALIEHLGTVEQKENGHLTFTVNGVSEVFHRSQAKDVSEVQQVLDLRRFLEGARVGRNGALDSAETLPPYRLLVVINQQETLIFRSEEKDSVPQRLHPHDPHGEMHRLNREKGGDVGSQATENLAYYREIAETLITAEKVLLMGNGTGSSSAMTHLKDYLDTHHPAISSRIVGTLTVDIEALTEGQLLQEARAHFLRLDHPDAPPQSKEVSL